MSRCFVQLFHLGHMGEAHVLEEEYGEIFASASGATLSAVCMEGFKLYGDSLRLSWDDCDLRKLRDWQEEERSDITMTDEIKEVFTEGNFNCFYLNDEMLTLAWAAGTNPSLVKILRSSGYLIEDKERNEM